MLQNIREHSFLVARVADTICAALYTGVKIDAALVNAAALLHDITKTESFVTKEPHAESGGRLLRTLGYPEIASIVAQHIRLDSFDPLGPLNEAEIVFYADKRVCHSTLVSEKERIADLLVRYGKSEADRRRIVELGGFVTVLGEKIMHNVSEPLETVMARV